MRVTLAHRAFLFVAVLLALVAGRSGVLRAQTSATAEARETVTIDIPYQPASYGTTFFDETAREFERLRPDVRVRMSADVRVRDKVRVRAMAEDWPDASDAVLVYDRLIASGKIRELTRYLEGPNWEGDARWIDTFVPGSFDRWRRGEGIYAIPFTYSIRVFFYNRKLFAQNDWSPPRTWEEFFELCEKIRATGLAPATLPGVYMRYGDPVFLAAHYNLAGPEGFRAYQELMPGTYTDPRFVRAAGVLQRLSTQHLLKGWEGMTHTAAGQAFLEGRSAMTVAGSWFVGEMRGKGPADFEMGAFNLPVFAEGGIGAPDAVLAQSAFFFFFETGDPGRERASIDFFRFLTSRERAREFARRFDALVALRTVQPDDYTTVAMRQIAEITQRASATYDSAPPPGPAFLAFTNQGLNDARFHLMTGSISPEEFGQRLERVAAAERARLADPERVNSKHASKAAMLAALIALVVGWLLRRRAPKRPPPGDEDDGARREPVFRHGRLRAPVAAGFVGPALVLFAAFVVLPGLASLVWAFQHWDGFGERSWAGLFNFKWLLLESDTFWYALRNNLYLMIVPALFVVPLALFLATLIHRGVWGANFFRAVFLFPNLLGGIAATLLWMNAYDPHGGLVNASLVKLGDLTGLAFLKSFAGYAWLSQNNLYRALIPIYLWMACGFNLVLYLAAMQGINPELYEAAELDGAPPWRQFFTITLPLIWDVLAISAVFIVIAGLNTFEMVWLLTSQDPNSSTHVLSTLMISTMFEEFQVGRATAIAVVMFVLVLVGSAVVLRVMRSREEH
jgi:ABC-type sugar transport system permease subunit/ABC-type glycerol-3-phosphate transport system substrate-binding protein